MYQRRGHAHRKKREGVGEIRLTKKEKSIAAILGRTSKSGEQGRTAHRRRGGPPGGGDEAKKQGRISRPSEVGRGFRIASLADSPKKDGKHVSDQPGRLDKKLAM